MKANRAGKDFILVVVGQIISLFGNAVLRFALPLHLLQHGRPEADPRNQYLLFFLFGSHGIVHTYPDGEAGEKGKCLFYSVSVSTSDHRAAGYCDKSACI